MTDNEIIKAFECCNNDGCENCPNRPTCCEIDVADEILNIINRQKAENERLQKEAERWKSAMMGECMLSACPNKEQLKSEAYREFAVRFKHMAMAVRKSISDNCTYIVDDEFIDRILKELTEGEMKP